jgi:hypothetical protein
VSSNNNFVLFGFFLWLSHFLFYILSSSYNISSAIFSFCFVVQVFPLLVPLLSLEVDNYRKSLPNTVPGPTRLSCKAKGRFLQNVHTKDAEIRSFSGERVPFSLFRIGVLITKSLPYLPYPLFPLQTKEISNPPPSPQQIYIFSPSPRSAPPPPSELGTNNGKTEHQPIQTVSNQQPTTNTRQPCRNQQLLPSATTDNLQSARDK